MSERLIRLLRTRVAPADGVADADLLLRWADRRDQAAFELLLRRHAEPVWRTCRAVAGEGAEDAFQATFLALARRAGAVRGNVPGWLHRVARHASLRARRAVPVRGRSFAWVADPPSPHGDGSPSRSTDDYAPLHEELARLPDAYRLPILLCHLHGRTQSEAATELGLPLGTVATRVRRGCDRLRVALTRRGLAPTLSFGPPLVLPASLIPAALGVGLGATAAPPAIHTLANGAVSAMSRTKLRATLAAIAVGCAVTGGAMLARPPAVEPQPAKPAPPAVAKWEPRPADFFDRKDCFSRLKQVGLALHNYADTHDGKLPADIVGKDGKPLLSWRVAVLPYVEQDILFGLFHQDEPWDSPHNKALLKHVPPVFRSAGAGPGMTRVKMFRGEHATLDPAGNRKIPQDFPDGTSNTLAAADAGAAVEWTKPGDLDFARDKPLPDLTGPFTDGYATVFMDGSARWLRYGMQEKILRLMIDREDATPIPDDDGPPPAKRPLNDREKKQAAEWQRVLERGQEYDQLTHDHLVAVTVAAAKLGPVPMPSAPPADDLFALEQAVNERFRRQAFAHNEADRLLELLKAKDPQTAAKVEKEFEERLKAMREKQRKK